MKKNNKTNETEFSRKISLKEKLKLKAQRRSGKSIWSGIGMFGLVGWSVATPTVVGALFGIWLDKHYPINHSWTLALLVAGLIIGCFFAWHWIAKESREIRKDEEEKDE
jgi:ATP synthase protein I